MSGGSRRRTLLLAALALTVPLPAFALSQDGATRASDVPVTLAVAASLAGCGLADAQVVCEISFTFDSVPGATSYTASVTSPDGSVSDVGAVGPGGGSAFVPYTGSGYYSVRVNAYGQREAEDDEQKLIATDVSHEVEPQDGGREPERTPGPDGGEPATEVEVTPTDEPGAPSEEPAPADDCAAAPAEPPVEAAPPAPAPQPGAEVAPDDGGTPNERQGALQAAEAEVTPAPEPAPAAPAPDPCGAR
jgi:2-oxoglutarate dehydrogenase E2 component (dihydrolipoamide succinyltransferase)